MRPGILFRSSPRHPWLRALVLAFGAAVLVGLAALGLVVGAAMVTVAAGVLLVRRWAHRRGQRQQGPQVIDGEFTVVAPRILPRER